MKLLWWLALSVLPLLAKAQCNTVSFAAPTLACLNQQIQLNPTSAGITFWDFCTGEFNNTAIANNSSNLPSAVGRPDIDLINDGTQWYGFVTGTWTNTLYRLTFNNGPTGDPTIIENLGDLGGHLNQPGPIKIVSENGQWYGLAFNTASGELLKLSFGSSLSNPVVVDVLFVTAPYVNAGLAIAKDSTNGWVCVLTMTNGFLIMRLGNSLTAPGSSDILSTTIPNATNVGNLDLVNNCGQWFGFADNFGSAQIYRLDFGTSLFVTPAVSQIASLSVNNPGRLKVVRDGDEYFMFVPSLDGYLTKLKFGTDLTSTPAVLYEGNLSGNLGTNLYGLDVAYQNSDWTIYSLSQANGQLYSIKYSDNCSAVPKTSSLQKPSLVYTSAGSYTISLSDLSSAGSVSTSTITISSLTAPDIKFSMANQCALNNTSFYASNQSGGIANYLWDFSDGSTSSSSGTASHIYSSASTFYPSLTVTASNGCQNFVQDTLQIFNSPQANFDLPLASPICTNQNYIFTNTSTYDVGSGPVWQWSVNGNTVSSAQDLNYLFSTTSAQSISLTASIPGCSTLLTQNIPSLEDGPLVKFNSPNSVCVGSTISFTNSTVGSISNSLWTYGDGNTSSQTDGANIYSANGLYQVTLSSSNAAGCQNSYSKNIVVYSVPQPNFAIEVAPSSCTDWPSQFDNNTPPLTDSNIISWLWNFGDGVSPTSTLPSPTNVYTQPGTYNVSLKATSNFGCTNSISLPVTISLSPQANFTNIPACVSQTTIFNDASQGSITKYQWSFQGSTVPAIGPVTSYVFQRDGSFNVTLTV
ncbi:MAG TPA: hypothetical protein DGG95_13220, partial [Cytophagales bacterium]|nr:hypothetical protein [Cytophagales bacterium]